MHVLWIFHEARSCGLNETSPRGLYVWIPSPQLARLYRKDGGVALFEKVIPLRMGFEASKGFHNFRMLSATCLQTEMYALKCPSSYLPPCLYYGFWPRTTSPKKPFFHSVHPWNRKVAKTAVARNKLTVVPHHLGFSDRTQPSQKNLRLQGN